MQFFYIVLSWADYLFMETILWADLNGIKKITLNVLETNEKAIRLYKKYGFEVEGILKQDKLLSDGKYYSTILMGRYKEPLSEKSIKLDK